MFSTEPNGFCDVIPAQVPLLHGVLSDKEYNVISTCISMNLCELPNLPSSFREDPSETKESIRILADKVNFKYNSQLLLSRTVFVIGVDIQYALLELRNGPDAESPLAQIAVSSTYHSLCIFVFPQCIHFVPEDKNTCYQGL
jgi:vacuolar protein sorting-associated protein 13A/C